MIVKIRLPKKKTLQNFTCYYLIPPTVCPPIKLSDFTYLTSDWLLLTTNYKVLQFSAETNQTQLGHCTAEIFAKNSLIIFHVKSTS